MDTQRAREPLRGPKFRTKPVTLLRLAPPRRAETFAYTQPRYLLGLTATPERSDGGDLLALCLQNLVYRCDLLRGIGDQLLCPFRYFGVPDTVDYSNIPWRSGGFDPEALEQALAVKARARSLPPVSPVRESHNLGSIDTDRPEGYT